MMQLSSLVAYVFLAVAANARAECPPLPPEEPSACRFDWSEKVGADECPLRIARDHPRCERLERLEKIFLRLRGTAGLSEQELGFRRQVVAKNESNAWYYPDSRQVAVSAGFIDRDGAHADVTAGVMAHEIAHAVQHRDGDRAWGLEKGSDGPEYERRRRVLEAHADTVGVELLNLAGYPSGTMRRGDERFLGCASIAVVEPSVNTHPAPHQRWANHHRAQELLDRRQVPEGKLAALHNRLADRDPLSLDKLFTGANARTDAGVAVTGHAPRYTPSIARTAFDDQGVFRAGRMEAAQLNRRVPAPSLSEPLPELVAKIPAWFLRRGLITAWGELRDWGAGLAPVRRLAVASCGTADSYDHAVVRGAGGLAADLTTRAVSWLAARN